MFSTRRRREAAWAVIGMLAMGLLLFSLATFYKMSDVVDTMRESQVESTERGKDIKRVVTLIQDCTDPDGTCFRQSQQRTAQAVNGINAATLRLISAGASCQADGITEFEALARCMAKRAASEE